MATNNNYTSSTKFADIVNDCLWYTFEYQSVKEKVGLMRVCKRWRKVATDLIENESCLELNLMKKKGPKAVRNDREYVIEEGVKQNLIAVFGNEASLFNYKLEHVEQVRIIGLEGPCRHIDYIISRSLALTLADIGWLFKRFPQLNSLCLDHVEILDPELSKSEIGQQLKDLNLPSRLKSLRHISSSSSYFWVYSLIEKDNVLEELRLNTKTFPCLKPAKLPFLKIVSLKTSVPQLFDLIANSPDISVIRLRGLNQYPDHKRGLKPYSLIPFMKLPQLRTLAIGYDTRLSSGLTDGGEMALKKYLSSNRKLKFSNLKLFKLSGLVMAPGYFGLFLSKMPTIESLRLRNIYFPSLGKHFVECLITLPNLRELYLNNNSDKDCNECLMASLAQFIPEEQLPKLRKLKCCLKDLFSPFLYEAFTNLAWKYPRESFVMMAPFDDQANKAELFAIKPRNLIAIHCRCTSKQETR